MVRTECTRLINHLFQSGKINEERQMDCLERINCEKSHKHIRNLVMMFLLPKRLHFDGEHQGAFLRAAVSRVRKFNTIKSKSNLFFFLDCESDRVGARGIILP